MTLPIGKVTGVAPMPASLIDAAGDVPFMPAGREQKPLPEDRVVFEQRPSEDGEDPAG